jgi:vacuolar iron transporter family protein
MPPTVGPSDKARYWTNWQGEVDGAATYRALERSESDPRLSKVYGNLALMEEAHAGFWELRLKAVGEVLRPRRPSLRARVLMWLARRFGPNLIVPTLAAFEQVDKNEYAAQPETANTNMAAQERWHAKVMREMMETRPHEGVEGGFLGRMEGRHRNGGGNALRAAVLGANDGLCSNLSLIMGVAGATDNSRGTLIAGLAGLLAGACSMALGEWISVTSSRELAEREIQIESDELEMDPKGEGDELRLIYEAKGLTAQEAKEVTDHLLSQKASALDTLVREELGIDPKELGGSARTAALTSFFLFSAGAIVPLLPFFFTTGMTAVLTSVGLSGVALFGTGAAITLFTGRPMWISGLRQLVLGLLAAGVVFGIGKAVGVAIAG